MGAAGRELELAIDISRDIDIAREKGHLSVEVGGKRELCSP